MYRVLLLALAGFLCGCRSHPDDAVRRYLQLAVALGERDPDAIDYYYGPADLVGGVRAHPPTLREIKQGALDLMRRPPSAFLTAQLKAIVARVDLLQGVKVSFDDEALAFFDLRVPPPRATNELDHIRREIDRLLPGAGSLASRYAAFETRLTIPAGRLPEVIERAMQACRDRTLQRMKLPPGERVTIEYAGDKPWNAYSFYQGNFHSSIRINADFPLTVDRALQLSCHEGYPGHHVFNSLIDQQLVERNHRLELTVQPTFSPQSFLSEALATYAGDLAFPGDDRLQFERDVLFPIAGIHPEEAVLYLRVNRLVDELQIAEPAIARQYLNGDLEWVRAASALEDQVLMTHTEATLKYLNEYRTYMLTYTVGREMVKACFSKHSSADLWQLYEKSILNAGQPLQAAAGLCPAS